MTFSSSIVTRAVLASLAVLTCTFVPNVQAENAVLPVQDVLLENLPPLQDGVDKVVMMGSKTPLIIGGESVSQGYPWYSMLLRENEEGQLFFACGATLIAKNYLLTAAHCVSDDFSYGGVWIGALSNVSGANNGGQYSELVRIDKLIGHPSWDENTFDNDFALIKITGSSTITPVDLDISGVSMDYESEEQKLTALGFGCVDPSEARWEQTLRKVELIYLNKYDCTHFPTSLFPEGSVTDNMMCATDDDKSLCRGDSGSALFDEEREIVTGVASWGRLQPFNPTFFPSVFARVSAQADWIKATVCEEFSESDSNIPSWCIESEPPTPYPTVEPTAYPTTASPTPAPTAAETSTPTANPTPAPTAGETSMPTANPTITPVPPKFPTPAAPSFNRPGTPGAKTHEPTVCEMEYNLTIMTDKYGYETSWEIAYYETGEVVASSPSGESYPNYIKMMETGCLPYNCYVFTIRDSFGDGICCEHGGGGYFLMINKSVVAEGGKFKTREKSLFGTCRPIE